MAVAPRSNPAPRASPSSGSSSKGLPSSVLILLLFCLGGLFFASLLYLEGPTAGPSTSHGWRSLVSSVSVKLRAWASDSKGAWCPADDVACGFLFTAQSSPLHTLSGGEAAEVLLSGLLAAQGDEVSSAAIRATESVVKAQCLGSMPSPPATPHVLPGLFLLAVCRHWPAWNSSLRLGLQGTVGLSLQYLTSKVSAKEGLFDARGLYDPRGFGDAHAAHLPPMALAVSSLAQVEAMAALRCAGGVLLPHLAEEQAAGGVTSALVTAERLRRGLNKLYLPSDESGPEGPFDLGSVTPLTTLADAPTHGSLDNATLKRVRSLSSQLPLLLLFLETGDFPAKVLREIAESSLSLSTPVGLSLHTGKANSNPSTAAAAITADTGVGGGGGGGVPWRVSPLEQALITVGALKHLLPLSLRAREEEDIEFSFGEEWRASDYLLLLADCTMRAAAPLAVLEKEATLRSMEALKAMKRLLKSGKLGGGGGEDGEVGLARKLEAAASGEGGLTPQSYARLQGLSTSFLTPASERGEGAVAAASGDAPPPTAPLTTQQAGAFVSTTVHAMTFPEYFTPLMEGDVPVAPKGASPPLLTAVLGAWMGRIGMAGKDARGGEGAGRGPPPGSGGSNAATAMFYYPPTGLSVLRPLSAKGPSVRMGGEHVVIPITTPVKVGQGGESKGHGKGAWDSVSEGGAFYILSHFNAPTSKDGGKAVGGEINLPYLIRGAGMPLSLGSAAAGRFFRVLYEGAVTWHRGVEEAARARRARWGEYRPKREKLMQRVKRLAASLGNKLKDAAAWPLHHLLLSKEGEGVLSSRAMLQYLTSGAADVTLLQQGFHWGIEGVLGKMRDLPLQSLLDMEKKGGALTPPTHGGDGGHQRTGPHSLTPLVEQYNHSSSKGGEEVFEGLGHVVEGAMEGGEGGGVVEGKGKGKGKELPKPPSLSLPAPPPNKHTPPLTPKVEKYTHEGENTTEESSGHVVEDSRGEVGGLLPVGAARAVRTVNITALFLRICPALLPPTIHTLEQPPWATCCAPKGLPAFMGKGREEVRRESDLPTFPCSSSSSSTTLDKVPAHEVSCGRVLDNFCDCLGDGVDEEGRGGGGTSACAAVPGARFFCPSGALSVVEGALVVHPTPPPSFFISATKVNDGVKDCVEGEDEAVRGS